MTTLLTCLLLKTVPLKSQYSIKSILSISKIWLQWQKRATLRNKISIEVVYLGAGGALGNASGLRAGSFCFWFTSKACHKIFLWSVTCWQMMFCFMFSCSSFIYNKSADSVSILPKNYLLNFKLLAISISVEDFTSAHSSLVLCLK